MKKVWTLIAFLGMITSTTLASPQLQAKADEVSQLAAPAVYPETVIITAPGSKESNLTDDPINPPEHAGGLIDSMTRTLKQNFAADIESHKLLVWQLPYAATLDNYDESRNGGEARLTEFIRNTRTACPNTNYILVGYSQGADIVGDIASDTGNNSDALIPADKLLGVTLFADPRRAPGQGIAMGSGHADGAGIEVSTSIVRPYVDMAAQANLLPAATINNLQGFSSRPARSNGFGSVNDRVINICNFNDSVCDLPTTLADLPRYPRLSDAVHVSYLQPSAVVPGITMNQWLNSWVSNLLPKQ
ncbi:MAG: cutinase family protein [Corynebacterium sp.]|nr:cutinase family protein [Corynebacterium sp.]